MTDTITIKRPEWRNTDTIKADLYIGEVRLGHACRKGFKTFRFYLGEKGLGWYATLEEAKTALYNAALKALGVEEKQ